MTMQPKKPATPADVAVALMAGETSLGGSKMHIACKANGEVNVYVPHNAEHAHKYFHAVFARHTARLLTPCNMPRSACEMLASLGFQFTMLPRLVAGYSWYADAKERARVESSAGYAWITKTGAMFQVYASERAEDAPINAIAEFQERIE